MKTNFTGPAASYLGKRAGLTQSEEEVVRYGLQIILYSLAGLLSISIAGWLLGCLFATLAVTFSSGFLRYLSGGAHSGSPVTCTLLGMLVAPLLGKSAMAAVGLLSPASLALIILVGFIPSMALLWRLAPVDSPAKPITSPSYRRRLRLLSLTSVVLMTLAQLLFLTQGAALSYILAVSLGIWWQTFTLTKAGHRFATLLDKITERGGMKNETTVL